MKRDKKDKEYRGDFKIVTDVKDGEQVAHGGNTNVYLDDILIPYLAACHVRIVTQEPVKLMLEIIPQSLELETKNAEAGMRFAYQDNTFWHEMKTLIEERNARLDRTTGDYTRPKVVFLCGRYNSLVEVREMDSADSYFNSKGYIVMRSSIKYPEIYEGNKSPTHDEDYDEEFNKSNTEQNIRRLIELDKRKIDLCNMVCVVNVDGIISDSMKKEIAYAEKYRKVMRYMFREGLDGWIQDEWRD